jgi:hypothetical protein
VTDAEWLAVLEDLGRRGFFRHEPDFPVALAAYRAAVEAAGPPDPLDPHRHVPEWDWVMEIGTRVESGRPPQTEAEFYGLKAWYLQNEHRIPLDQGVRLGRSELATSWSLHCRLDRGPRAYGASDLVACLRRLKAASG